MQKVRSLALITAIFLSLCANISFAAFDDATIEKDTVIDLAGESIIVSGDNASLESMTVDDTMITVRLGQGSHIDFTAVSRRRLRLDSEANMRSSTCDSSNSSVSLSYSGVGTVTNTISLASDTCRDTEPVKTVTQSVPETSVARSGSRISDAILRLLGILPRNKYLTANVGLLSASNTPATSTTMRSDQSGGDVQVSLVANINRDLQVGSVGDDVMNLQRFLNTKGYVIAKNGPGSPGKETDTFGSLTKYALMKFQKANKLPSTGYFGPKTRSLLKSME